MCVIIFCRWEACSNEIERERTWARENLERRQAEGLGGDSLGPNKVDEDFGPKLVTRSPEFPVNQPFANWALEMTH